MIVSSIPGDMAKPSFAKVAASASTRAQSNPPARPQETSESKDNDGSGGSQDKLLPEKNAIPPNDTTAFNSMSVSLDALSIQPDNSNSCINNGNAESSTSVETSNPVLARESGSDESQRADSNSDLGTKPPSLDGKSITSGTTFALDEKESLRPDDSASVQAAGEDDDAFSIRGSLIAGSRYGSDLAARARGIQLGDMPERRLLHPTPGITGQGIMTPQSASSEQQSESVSGMPPLQTAERSADALKLIYQHAPDDKLIEAMSSSKDRLFLLKLEKEVIDFVQNSKEPYMDLPPSNSFCRMLTHKLADYYHMTHSFEPVIGAVRIFRTPFCRVPTSLAHLDAASEPQKSEETPPPPVILPKRIMRRGQSDETGGAGNGLSMPTSEVGSESKDGKDKQQGSQKLTREEREEMYKIARERIFGSSEETPEDGDTGVSRASSVSVNSRSNAGKRTKNSRQRRDDSDSFDSRNHYTQCWGPQQQTWVQQYPLQSGQMAPQPPTSNGGQMPLVYGQQSVGYSGMPPIIPGQSYQYSSPQPPQPPQQRYPASGNSMTPYGAPMPAAAAGGPQQQQQVWQQSTYNSGAPQSYPTRSSAPPGPQSNNGVPYPFGQLPMNNNPHDPKSQHPIPGSYNRNHAFNPKTQSFVPGGNGMHPNTTLQPPFTAPTSHHSSPQINSTALAFPQYQQGMPQPYCGGYGMTRQPSNTSAPVYHASQPISTVFGQHQPPPAHNPHQHTPIQHSIQHLVPNQPSHIPNRPNIPPNPKAGASSHQMYSHLPAYGNPASLPQKPPAGI